MSGSARPALTTAVVAALTGDAALVTALGGAAVWVNVPDKTPPPFLWVLAGEETPIERTLTRADRRQVAVEVTAVSAYWGSAEIDALLSRVIEVLTPEGARGPVVNGYTAVWSFVRNGKPEMGEALDGTLVWMGTAEFTVQLL